MAVTSQDILFRKAVELHQRGELARALSAYEVLLEQQPTHVKALHLAAILALRLDDAQQGLALIERAICLDEQDAIAHFNRGVALRALQRLPLAVCSFDRAILLRPQFAAAHLQRALTLLDLGRLEAALAAVDTVLSLLPGSAEALLCRGVILERHAEPPAALACYERILQLDPRHADALFNRGNVLRTLGRGGEALQSYEAALAVRPRHAPSLTNRGIVLAILGERETALESFDQALALDPTDAEALNGRGAVLEQTGRLEEALDSLERALRLRPGSSELDNNRGNVLRELGRLPEARESLERALRTNPAAPATYGNLGNLLRDEGDLDGALDWYERALARDPVLADAHSNRAVTLQGLGRLEEALAGFDRALSIDPKHARARLNRAMALLCTGDFERGWQEYEWRWRTPEMQVDTAQLRALPPRWTGAEPLAGKSILLRAEQGFGDTLQFCRYARDLATQGTCVVLQVPAALLTLMRGLGGVAQVLDETQAPPACDYHCSLLSLPLALKTALGSIPAAVSYLRADPERGAYWAQRLGPRQRPRVGVVWSGGFRPGQPLQWPVNRRRNVQLALLAPFAQAEVDFYSLQKGQPAESELSELEHAGWAGPRFINHTAELHDFADTAALIEQLDLVISVDTALVHLSGALGKPVWILNRFDTCWRWLLERSDSPWYPTARLYRQTSAGGWGPVIERVLADLRQLASGSASPERGSD